MKITKYLIDHFLSSHGGFTIQDIEEDPYEPSSIRTFTFEGKLYRITVEEVKDNEQI